MPRYISSVSISIANIITTVGTNSIELSPSRETARSAATQELPELPAFDDPKMLVTMYTRALL
jgi:hypothetical protein